MTIQNGTRFKRLCKPAQNVTIEDFSRTFLEDVLDFNICDHLKVFSNVVL